MIEENKKKKVSFDFYQVWKVSNNQEKVFDFDDWCELMETTKKKLDDRNIGYNGDIIRCNNIYVSNAEKNPITILHFLRMRRGTTPAVANLNLPKLQDVKLESDEYIAEDVSALFDSTNYVLMLQKIYLVFQLKRYNNMLIISGMKIEKTTKKKKLNFVQLFVKILIRELRKQIRLTVFLLKWLIW